MGTRPLPFEGFGISDMGTYTPPDIPDELYNFLKPSDALMLRGLVAKFNKEMSNCVRVVAARPELVPSVEEIFQQNLHKNLAQAPVVFEKLDGANVAHIIPLVS